MEYANYSEEDLRSPAYSNEPRKPAPWRRRIIPLGFTKARQWNCRACQASVSFLQCKTSYLIFFFLFFVTFWLGVKKPYPWTIVLFSSGTGSLVVVKCEKRRQSYCLLCSVRLRKGDHMTSNSHRYKYLVCVCVRARPEPRLRQGWGWTCVLMFCQQKFHSFAWDLDEKRMLTAVTHLADLEKVQGTVVKVMTAARPSPKNLIN